MAVIDSSNREQLIQALRSILFELETASGVSSESPDLLALKSIVLNRITELELMKVEGSAVAEVSLAGVQESGPTPEAGQKTSEPPAIAEPDA